jgi:ABC-type sugar transport system substrate-binding protein
MKGKKLLLLVGLLSMVGLILGAVQAAPTSAQGQPKQLNFCVVHNNADHPSIAAIVQGMNDEAKIYNVKMTYFDPAFDPQKQLKMIDDCIALKPDAIFVNSVDPAAVIPGLKKVYDAKIPLIMENAGTTPEGEKYIQTFVTSDVTEQGRAVGRAMVATLPDNSKCVVITGNPGQYGVKERIDGALEVIKASGKNIQFIDQQTARWNKDTALTVMQDFLTKYPEGAINCVYGEDDPMALGALQAIKAANRLKGIKVYGVNGNKEACQAIKNGEMFGTALQLSYLVGVYSIRAGYDAVVGRQLPSMMMVPTAAINPQNVDQYMSQCW